MLLNEFLKKPQKVQRLESALAQQRKQIEALTTTVQKVSDWVELSKSATRVVVNNPDPDARLKEIPSGFDR